MDTANLTPSQTKRDVECPECGQMFITQRALGYHLQIRGEHHDARTANRDILPSRGAAPQSTIGTVAELAVAMDLLNRGFDVYRALSPNAQCDLIATKGDATLRIEVKSTVMDGLKVRSRSANRGSRVDHIALIVRPGQIYYRPDLP